jgi:hypothetical protein
VNAGSRSPINGLANKLQVTGNMINNKKCVVGKKKSVRIPENIHHIEWALKAESQEIYKTSFSAS